ncbi:hypothetical protein VTI74DRAFT_7764 [Chaetomium olivicolor]
MARKSKPIPAGDSPPELVKSAQAKAQDDQVMATNNSSIVSKRSVEKLYYPDEPHFFRYFVKRFLRRAPLINRGYWLRLRAIDVLVRDFLKGVKGRGRRGVVVNLGCGSDVLPWQCITRYAEDCENVKFVDVDFPDLIGRKRQTVLDTPELLGILTGVKNAEGVVKPVVFESDKYVQIGCDLRDLKTLQRGLAAAVGDFAACEFIFVAEVSITYMETEGADGVIRWASTVGDAEFVLLEQILPDGEDHPFASTMLRHFEKLNTQLKSVRTYPTVADQHARFSSRGWDSVRVWTLWETWADETFLSPSERLQLDEIEQFDEWEEFALFASHYCVVHAKAGRMATATAAPPIPTSNPIPVQHATLQFDPCPGQRGQRRFATGMQLSEHGKRPLVLNALGLGTKCRLQSCDVFSSGAADGEAALTFREGGPTARMCHSLTDLGRNGVLLAGGRESPSRPFKDCWLFDKNSKTWKKTHDLPAPLYRHAVTALGMSGLALLVGGRDETDAFDGCLLYHPEDGWVSCEVVGDRPAAVYGAVLASASVGEAASFSGIYAGGLEDGLISDQFLSWQVDVSDIKKPTIQFTPLRILGGAEEDARWVLTRFGATCLPHGNEFIIMGGVARGHLLSHQDEVLLCSVSKSELAITRRLLNQASVGEESIPRPLFVGHSAISMPDGRVVVIGGGATCFSMGTFWNSGVYTLRIPAVDGKEPEAAASSTRWVHETTIDIATDQPPAPRAAKPRSGDGKASITPIPRVKLETADDFLRILRAGQPVVLEGLGLGSCVSAWTLDYLVDKVGEDRKESSHPA